MADILAFNVAELTQALDRNTAEGLRSDRESRSFSLSWLLRFDGKKSENTTRQDNDPLFIAAPPIENHSPDDFIRPISTTAEPSSRSSSRSSENRRRDDQSSDISSHVSLDCRSGALDFPKTMSTNGAKIYLPMPISRSLNSLENICQYKPADRAEAFRGVVDLIQGVAKLIHRESLRARAERARATPSRLLEKPRPSYKSRRTILVLFYEPGFPFPRE